MPMSDRYKFSMSDDSVYRFVLDLIERHRPGQGTVMVDVGCGYVAIAETIRDLGMVYIGCDVETSGLVDLADRGFETEVVDLRMPDDAVTSIEKRLGDRALGAITMIDVLEHVTNGPEVLTALSGLALRQRGVPLVLAVPNVTHYDIAAKLLLGRWHMTALGLLDDTHVSFFSDLRLQDMTTHSGWAEIGASDFPLRFSDQHVPGEAAVLQEGAPLHDLLMGVRERSSSAAIVNEFVRAYAPMGANGGGSDIEVDEPAPFLSILMRTQGTRPTTLQEALLSLAAQNDQDFEVLLLAHMVHRDELTHLRYLADSFGSGFSARVSIIPVDGGGRSRPLNVGVELARGKYICILDDDDVVFGHWLESFRSVAAKYPGRVLRSPVAEQEVEPTTWAGGRLGYEVRSRPRCRWPEKFDVLDHLWENHSPPCGWAIPRSAFVDLGLVFDESLPVLEDWDVLMQAVLWCGVADTGEVTAVWRRWFTGDSSTSVHSDIEWDQARTAVIAKFDANPLLLPAHSMTAIQSYRRDILDSERELARLRQEALDLHSELNNCRHHAHHLETLVDEVRREVETFRRSSSWRLSKPVRVIGSSVRRLVNPEAPRAAGDD